MALAPQRSNPGTRGQNVRYDLRGFQQIGPDRYTDGTYTYSGDVDNALSDNRPDSVVEGLFGADDDRSRDPMWRPGQPMPNRAAPPLIGQAMARAQRGRPAPGQSPAAYALIESLIGKATRGVNEINARTQAKQAELAPFAGRASGYFDDARRQAQGVGDAVSGAIRGTGQALQGDLAAKLGGIQAPGQAVDAFAGGQGRTGDAAAAAASGLSSAELDRLKGYQGAEFDFFGALPRIADLAGAQDRRAILNTLGGQLVDKLPELYASEYEASQKAKADAAKQAALDRYRNSQLGLSRQRLAETRRQGTARIRQGDARVQQGDVRLAQGNVRLAQGQQRLNETAEQHAAANAQAWARIGITDRNSQLSASRNQLAWDKFRQDPTGKSGGYTKSQVGKLRSLAGQEAAQSFKGYWALEDDVDTPLTTAQLISLMKQHDVATPAELNDLGIIGKYQRSYQETMTRMLNAGVPLVMAQSALNRFWTKPGDPRPEYANKQGSGRPTRSFQERNPGKAGAGPSVGAASTPREAALIEDALDVGPRSDTRYVFGGASPKGYDCSGYTLTMVKRQTGVSLPHNAAAQFHDPRGVHVAPNQLRPGDVVFFESRPNNGSSQPPWHCGYYIGGGRFVEYYSSGQPARVSNLSDRPDYMGARRFGARR